MSLPNGVVKPGGADLVVSRQDSQGTASHRPNIGLNRASPSRGSASGWPSETANLLCRCRHAISLLTTIQFASANRFFPHRSRRALRQETPLISDRQLQKTIDDLRRLERKCFASRSRFAFYDYLAAVFELYVQLRRRNQAKPSARRIRKLFGLREQDRTHPIRTIIDGQISRPKVAGLVL